MKCSQCGHTIPETSQHCAYCGVEIQQVVPLQPQAQSRELRRIALRVLVLIGLGILVVVGLEVIDNLTQESPQIADQQVKACLLTELQPTPSRIEMPLPPELNTDDYLAFGPLNAPITIIEFGDYICPYSQIYYIDIFSKLMEAYPDQIRFVYRHFPVVALQGFEAALAAECANEQGVVNFWGFHHLLLTQGIGTGRSTYIGYAEYLGIDSEALAKCFDDKRYAAKVEADAQDAVILGAVGTPTFFVNGIPITGAQPLSAFIRVIDTELGK